LNLVFDLQLGKPMFNFSKLLKGPATSKDIKAAIEKTEAGLENARDRYKELNDQRGDILLDGTAAQVKKHDAEIETAAVDIERLGLGMEKLLSRLAEVQQAEDRAGLDQKLEIAEAASKKGEGQLRKYGPLAKKLQQILIDLTAIDEIIAEANAAAKDAGDERRVASPNKVMRGVPEKVIPAHKKKIPEKPAWDAKHGMGIRVKGSMIPGREVQVPEKILPGRENAPLHRAVLLPAADESEECIWPMDAGIGAGFNLNLMPNVDGMKNFKDRVQTRVSEIKEGK